jgi:hypothetical protein
MPPTAAHLLKLDESVGQIYFGASCEDCRHGLRRIDVSRLVAQLGPDVLVQDVRPRLRCAKCGGKRVR